MAIISYQAPEASEALCTEVVSRHAIEEEVGVGKPPRGCFPPPGRFQLKRPGFWWFETCRFFFGGEGVWEKKYGKQIRILELLTWWTKRNMNFEKWCNGVSVTCHES